MSEQNEALLTFIYNDILSSGGEGWLPTIYQHCLDAGYIIGGKWPENNLRARMSRAKHLFRPVGMSHWRTVDANGQDTHYPPKQL